MLQITIGNQGKIKVDKVKDGNLELELRVGSLIAVRPDKASVSNSDNYGELLQKPWIGKVVTLPENGKVSVNWLTGSTNSTWTFGRSMKTKSACEIPVKSIYLWNFSLLSNKHLEKKAIDEIRKEMIKLQQKYMAESDEVDEMEFL